MRMPLRTLGALALLSTATLGAQPKPAAKTDAPKAAAAARQIDINSASATDLEAIPGIGKAYAAKIIAGRPYANKLQLVQKKVLSQALYDRIKDQIIAKQ